MALYHYCTNEAFFSIVDKRELWLSSLGLSNDSMEGRHLSSLISQIAYDDGLKESWATELRKHIEYFEGFFDGLGFCLSERGDQLSQWRGYAADGSGVSIGFSREYLERFGERSRAMSARSTPDSISGFNLEKVIYKKGEHLELLRPYYEEIRKKIEDGALEPPRRSSLLIPMSEEDQRLGDERHKALLNSLSLKVLMLYGVLFRIKSDAFEEEMEWRLISMVAKSGDKFDVRPSSNKLVPFRKYSLPMLDVNPLEKIILGPKNVTPSHVVENFLVSRGYVGVEVARSSATYR